MDAQSPNNGDVSLGLEQELRELSEAMTLPRPRECLVCYVFRMIDLGCHGQQWMRRYRDLCAPRATALEARMESLGGYCDCEMLMNSFSPDPRWFRTDGDGEIIPQSMPSCGGVRGGSTQPCWLWMARRPSRMYGGNDWY